MAQGDTVTIDPTEKVEVTFLIDFKQADVKRLADGDRFAELAFLMDVPARRFTHRTRQRGGNSPHADPPFIKMVGDDGVIRAIFSFVGNDAGGQPRFRSGDKIDLFCLFQSVDFEPAPEPATLLGTVTIK